MVQLIQLFRHRTRLIKPLAVCLIVSSLSACALQDLTGDKASSMESPASVSRLQETIRQQRSRILALELRLVAQQSEIKRLSSAQEQAIQEIVRVKAKLRSRNSKAETVANLAEVKLALQGLDSEKIADFQTEALSSAKQYVAMSESALQEGNYDGASYLIAQAKSSLRAATTSPDERQKSNQANSFSVPVVMTVLKRGNVRKGPGMERRVLTQMKPGSRVMATGYQGAWVRVRLTDETSGWIHFSLLKADI